MREGEIAWLARTGFYLKAMVNIWCKKRKPIRRSHMSNARSERKSQVWVPNCRLLSRTTTLSPTVQKSAKAQFAQLNTQAHQQKDGHRSNSKSSTEKRLLGEQGWLDLCSTEGDILARYLEARKKSILQFALPGFNAFLDSFLRSNVLPKHNEIWISGPLRNFDTHENWNSFIGPQISLFSTIKHNNTILLVSRKDSNKMLRDEESIFFLIGVKGPRSYH